MELLFKMSNVQCQRLKTLREKTNKQKQKLVSKWVIGKHNIIYLQRQNDTSQVQIFKNFNGDVNITGNRRALAEGKEASISFHSESKCFFFSIMGIFHKTLNLALEVLDQSQGTYDYYLS